MRVLVRTSLGIALVVFFVSAMSPVFGNSKRFVYTVTGRVVYPNGNPVPSATVELLSPQYSEGHYIIPNSSDLAGYFVIQKDSSVPVSDWRLWVSDHKGPDRAVELFSPYMGSCDIDFKSICGKRISISPNRVTNLGDIPVGLMFYPVILHFVDNTNHPLIREHSSSKEDVFNPWWRIRDPLGDIIGEIGNLRYHYEGSALVIAPPVGKWTLDINDNGLGGIFDVEVGASHSIPEIYVKVGTYESIEPSFTFGGHVSYSAADRTEARRALVSKGQKIIQSVFEKRVILGNHQLVLLYLKAGMNPNVLTKNDAVLVSVIDRPEILKLLLEAGADPNRRMKDGSTPLLRACERSRYTSVKMLLDANAALNAVDKKRRNCFSLAAERDEDVLRLLNEVRNQRKKEQDHSRR